MDDWQKFKKQLRQVWDDLSDDELDRFRDRLDELEDYIREKTGETLKYIREIIKAIGGLPGKPGSGQDPKED